MHEIFSKMKTKREYKIAEDIDIQCEIMPVEFDELHGRGGGESSADIRARVIAARQIQAERYAGVGGVHCNAQMTPKFMQEHCVLTDESTKILKRVMTRYDMSARAYDRILKVARTIADLDASPTITPVHISEAVGYRTLDRGNWGKATPVLP